MAEDLSIDLVRQFRAGDALAAEEIFQRYVRRLVALADSRLSAKLAHKMDPEDIVQSAFHSFFAGMREGQFELRRSGDLWRLLAAITVNKVLKKAEHFGADKRRLDAETSGADQLNVHAARMEKMSGDPTPDDVVALAEELELVLRDLPPAHRDMLTERLRGAAVSEIAAQQQVTERQVRRVLQKVQQQLESRLIGTASDEPTHE